MPRAAPRPRRPGGALHSKCELSRTGVSVTDTIASGTFVAVDVLHFIEAGPPLLEEALVAAGALAGLRKRIAAALGRVGAAMRRWGRRTEQVGAVLSDDLAGRLVTEVTCNGGESNHLGDRVVRIEARLIEGDRRMDRIEAKLDQAAKDVATVAAWTAAGAPVASQVIEP